MATYILRRLLLGIPTIFGVLFLLFSLFFWFASPSMIAKRVLGEKATSEQITIWINSHGYDLPKFINNDASGTGVFTKTRLFEYYKKMLTADFGRSDIDNVPIVQKIKDGAGPSLALTIPSFIIGLSVSIFISLLVAMFRGTYVDKSVLVLCVLGMSIVYFLYIIGGQYYLGKVLKWYPISGWSSNSMMHFLRLPILVGVIAGIGSSVRFYRTVMVNEVGADYIRTARAKGLNEMRIMFLHLLKNAMIPILTNVVMAIPFLFMGSLLLEQFFGIPGLGKMLVTGIQNNDFRTVSALVYISSLIYIFANIMTDLSYTLVDPRVRLK